MPLKSYSEDAPRDLSSLLLEEINRAWSREKRTLAPITATLPVGAVLAEGADGSLVPYLKTAADSLAVAVSLEEKKAEASPAPVVVLSRGAVVAAAELSFLESVTEVQKTAAKKQLAARGIVPQE
jgi:hypothetical protein